MTVKETEIEIMQTLTVWFLVFYTFQLYKGLGIKSLVPEYWVTRYLLSLLLNLQGINLPSLFWDINFSTKLQILYAENYNQQGIQKAFEQLKVL
ncbi:hypothetical protein Glove_139g111 [Diversispora epigaea]|uniref:Uncharacterized protein n=1 Tax=Diversispora epigaea TaxID=1348612 RepID=A0A397IYJ8_9GLOM|nr:hypothetical protein Glove_139g111 [Diversispora epigaea]